MPLFQTGPPNICDVSEKPKALIVRLSMGCAAGGFCGRGGKSNSGVEKHDGHDGQKKGHRGKPLDGRHVDVDESVNRLPAVKNCLVVL